MVSVILFLSLDSYDLGKYWVYIMTKSMHTTTIRHCTGWIFLLTMQGRYLYCSTLAATTKYHRLRGSHKRHFLQFWSLGCSRSRCQQGRFYAEPHSLGFRWLPFGSVLTWPFLGACAEKEKVSQLSGVSKGHLSYWIRDPMFMTSSNLNYFLEAPFLNTATLRGRALIYKFGETQTFSP